MCMGKNTAAQQSKGRRAHWEEHRSSKKGMPRNINTNSRMVSKPQKKWKEKKNRWLWINKGKNIARIRNNFYSTEKKPVRMVKYYLLTPSLWILWCPPDWQVFKLSSHKENSLFRCITTSEGRCSLFVLMWIFAYMHRLSFCWEYPQMLQGKNLPHTGSSICS